MTRASLTLCALVGLALLCALATGAHTRRSEHVRVERSSEHSARGDGPKGRTGTIMDIEHIVIFMQENRAFDHYFGKMQGIRGFNDRAATILPNHQTVWYQPTDSAGLYMLPWHMDTLTTNGVCGEAPLMSYFTDIGMWNEGRMDQWNIVRPAGLGMSYFEDTDLPFYYELSKGFTIADQYFQSTFTETNPNRLHLFSGSNGLSAGGIPILDNTEPDPGFTWETMAETLEKANVTWKVYMEQDNFDDNGFAWFANFQKAKPGEPLFDKGMSRSANLVDEFAADLKSGALPQVSWIVGPTNASEHANHKPPYGEHLSAQLIQALKDNPDMYAKTAFILNYDEGGQFYDHHWTPTPPVDEADGVSTVTTQGEVTLQKLPIGLGFRVPAFTISPWSRGGYVNSQVFDHTSVLQFVEKRFGVRCPNISPWRRAVAGDLTSMFDFTKPDYTWPDLPDTSGYVAQADKECATLPPPSVPEKQSMPRQTPGTRPSRALPYAMEATIAYDSSATHGLMLRLANTGKQAVAMYLYNIANATAAPKKYTCEAGKDLSDPQLMPTEQGQFDFSLHGPNGYVRRFAGAVPTSASPTVSAKFDMKDGTPQYALSITNPASTGAVNVSVSWNAYVNSTDQVVSVAAGATQTITGTLPAHRWYDFTATMDAIASGMSSVRYMGRYENGEDSITDPAAGDADVNALHPFRIDDDKHPRIPPRLRAYDGIQRWLHTLTDEQKCIARHMSQK